MSALDAIREHALAVHGEREGYESLGVLVVSGDRALRYVKLANGARQPNKVRFQSERQLARPGGLPLIVVHSHPWSDTVPSDDDFRWAAHYGWDTLAIFSVPEDELRFWRLDGDAFVEVEFTVA